MSSKNAPSLSGLTPGELVRLFVEHRQKWILPTVACGALALLGSLFMARNWEATQGFVVRPEISGAEGATPGKFADLYQMRTFQETILELAKSQQVIVATLQAVGTAETGEPATVPTEKEIEEFRESLSLLPPKGAEFGKTEVCYFQVKNKRRERALKLVAELGRQIDTRLRSLRVERSQSLIDDLQQQVDRAQSALQVETDRLAEFESHVGADLGELRMLNASFSGQSDLRQQSVNLKSEHRSASIKLRELEQLLETLIAARNNPEKLVAMPNSLLESQPTLRRLKDGLVDAQLRLARLEGTRTAEHPQVRAAAESVAYIRRDLHSELSVAIRGVEVELQLGRNRVAQLEQQQSDVDLRLAGLAELRAGYANHTSAVENSRKVLDQAQKQLGEVSAEQAAARTASLVTAIDQPETGSRPAGPGRAQVTLVGAFGGFALGWGWLFLTALPTTIEEESRDELYEYEYSLRNSRPLEQAKMPTPIKATTEVASAPVPTRPPVMPVERRAESTPEIGKHIPSSLPPAVAAKIAELVAARNAAEHRI